MNETTATETKKFDGWAIVDVLGHQRYAGYVTTENYGQTAFFRVATPAREPRERTVESDEYVQGRGYLTPGSKIAEGGVPASERLIGAGSIYMLTPQTREQVLTLLDEIESRKVLSVTNPDGTPREVPEEMPW